MRATTSEQTGAPPDLDRLGGYPRSFHSALHMWTQNVVKTLADCLYTWAALLRILLLPPPPPHSVTNTATPDYPAAAEPQAPTHMEFLSCIPGVHSRAAWTATKLPFGLK